MVNVNKLLLMYVTTKSSLKKTSVPAIRGLYGNAIKMFRDNRGQREKLCAIIWKPRLSNSGD